MTEMVGLTCRVGAHNSRYAHDTRLYPNYMLVSHTRAKKVTWRHSMIYVKHEMQFQLINSIVNRQHVNTLEFIYTDMRSGSKVEKISHNFVL